jgi:hypothetical protein
MGGYPRFHQDRVNLLIHVVMVPVFVACAVGAAFCLVTGQWLAAGVLAAGPPLSMTVQGFGHRREPVPPLPFRGPGDFLTRILAEQFYKFPRFVLGGGCARAWRGSSSERGEGSASETADPSGRKPD